MHGSTMLAGGSRTFLANPSGGEHSIAPSGRLSRSQEKLRLWIGRVVCIEQLPNSENLVDETSTCAKSDLLFADSAPENKCQTAKHHQS